MRWLWIFLVLALPLVGLRAASINEVTRLVSSGYWQQAQMAITADLQDTNLDFPTRQDLLFQHDRMMRIRRDFNKSRAQVFQEARAIVSTITEQQFAAWEKSGSVEFLEIDGTRWYYSDAAANLFRVNPEAKALEAQPPIKDWYRLANVRNIIATYKKTGSRLNSPKHWRVTYSLSVNPGVVPPGEIIRAWLPFPHAGNRQHDIYLIAADPPRFVESDTNAALSSLYFEKPAESNAPTIFKIVFDYTADAFYQPLDSATVQSIATNDPALAPFLGEEPPHIVFSEKVKELSHSIVGDETNSYVKAQKIFAWVSRHIPWASTREYSTIECLPEYGLGGGHGDCGIKTMTFMTLCRLNGIPARWETGWVTDPGQGMHDWCEIYLAPYGWVPVDVTIGPLDSDDAHEKWFYLGGMDAGRLVLNTDYNQPLYPAKTFFRSEIVDFQRGEVEWRGGNLYFNQWDWNFNVEKVSIIH